MKYNDEEIGIPTLEQVRECVVRNGYDVSPEDVYNYYSKRNWLTKTKRKPIKTLEGVLNTWNGVLKNKNIHEVKKVKTLEKSDDKFAKWAIKTKKNLEVNNTKYELSLFKDLVKTFHNRVKFQNPFIISGKLYYSDISIPSLKLIIEVDGGYHNTEEQKAKDKQRDEDFKSIGYTTLRYTNEQVESREGKKKIVQEILSYKSK